MAASSKKMNMNLLILCCEMFFSVYFRLRLELESFLKIFAGPSFQPETKRRKDDDRFYYFSVF